jgi:hypothetical protein
VEATLRFGQNLRPNLIEKIPVEVKLSHSTVLFFSISALYENSGFLRKVESNLTQSKNGSNLLTEGNSSKVQYILRTNRIVHYGFFSSTLFYYQALTKQLKT